MKKILPCLLCLATVAGGTACSMRGLANRIIYRVDVQQGNLISQDMLGELHRGMSKEEVLETLGHPVLRDPFHPDDWYYVFTSSNGWEVREQRNLLLRFRDDRLVRMEGDVRPAAPDTVQTWAEQRENPEPHRALVIPDSRPKGFLQRLFSRAPEQDAGQEATDTDAAESDTVVNDPEE